ncbi:MAG: DUF58 domain-containing protein [Sulfolobales archaeon]|nr:DUF58 domain-containing protein [Sulfolobales archaeon]MDW8082456.1 DUF58 domain-containing protein [Sulfolobales archaeon]
MRASSSTIVIERSLSIALLSVLVGFSVFFIYIEGFLARYLLAVLTAYTSLSVVLERVIPKARAECFLGVERDLLVASESFTISVVLTSWLSPAVDVSEAKLTGSMGVSIVSLKTSRRGGSLRVDLAALARVGLHRVSDVQLVARVKAFALVFRVIVKADLVLRVVPRVDAAVSLSRAGVPYDIGLSYTGRIGSGTQFYGNREYRPGDELRHVDWKASSRTGRLVVKTFEREVFRRVLLVIPISERFFREFSEAFDALVSELLKIVAELVRRGTEVIVSVVSQQNPPLPVFVRIRSIDDLAHLAEYFSYVSWSEESRNRYLTYRSALWTSVKLLSEVPGRSIVIYLGEPESDVDIAAGRIVVNIVRNLGHEPIFTLVSPEVIRVTLGEPSADDLAELARSLRVTTSSLSSIARVSRFYYDDLLEFLVRSLSV